MSDEEIRRQAFEEAEQMVNGTVCSCGNVKLTRTFFCKPCWARLPWEVKGPLDKKTGTEFAEQWDSCREWLRDN